VRLQQIAILGFFICITAVAAPVRAMNLLAGIGTVEGSTQANEDEWNKGLQSLSDGGFSDAFAHWKIAGTPSPHGDKGYYLAQIGLSILSESGLGAPKDDSEAARWRALGQEDRHEDLQEQINSYSGSVYAIIGVAYQEGRGIEKDLDRARTAYFTAAAYENAEAEFRLGALFESGEGAASWDYEEAADYYSQAAKSGLAKAQFALATLYQDGRGVPQDYKRAYLWFSLAVANQSKMDNFDGANKRDELAGRMGPEQLASAQELAHQCMSSEYVDCD
jgi:TPR repeat protein